MLDTTLSELIGLVIVLFGLGFSAWALVDDAFDMFAVWRFGEVHGPRWIAATGHFLFNCSMLLAWLLFLLLISIAIYLPTRTDQPSTVLSDTAGWLRIGYAFLFLFGQVHQRVARFKLRRLSLDAWEQMIASLDARGRAALMRRLRRATALPREMGHSLANELQAPVTMCDRIISDPTSTDAERAEAIEAMQAIDGVMAHIRTLHAEARLLESQP